MYYLCILYCVICTYNLGSEDTKLSLYCVIVQYTVKYLNSRCGGEGERGSVPIACWTNL